MCDAELRCCGRKVLPNNDALLRDHPAADCAYVESVAAALTSNKTCLLLSLFFILLLRDYFLAITFYFSKIERERDYFLAITFSRIAARG